MGTPYAGQLTFTSDDYDELQNIKKAVSGGYRSDGTYDRTMINNLFPDTGDLGSEAANDAANQAATGTTDQSATADDGFVDQEDQSATADEGFEVFTDDSGNKRITKDIYDEAKLAFFKERGKVPQDATSVDKYAGKTFSPRDANLNRAFREHMMGKYGTASTLSPNAKTAYTQVGGGADFAQISSLPETSQVAQSIQSETNDKNILQKANEFATKHGKTITAASYLLDAVVPGAGKAIRTAQALNKGYNFVTGTVDSAMDDVLTKPTGIGGQIDLNETLSKGTTPEPEYDGNIGSIFFSDGGRVNKAVGGPLDLEARRKQSYEDYLARQGGVQPAAPQAPTTTSTTTSNTGSATPTTSTTTAPQPQSTAPQPFDMSKYQGGYFGGGIEDSRNIALGDLEELGVDVSKYRTRTAQKDPNAPTFKGYTNTELMMMSPEEFKQKLGFDPSVQGANAEFEKFIQSVGPQLIGPGGPAGVQTQFKNQDELAQILNRAIPFYMRTARDLGENYTLQEMLAMTDEELAALDDRYNKKMGYGKYAKTSPNIYNTGSRDKSQVQETMEYYSSNIKPQGTGIGLGSQYATGGRVGFRYGGEDAKVKRYMKTDYSNPFNRLTKRDIRRHQAYNSAVLNKGKKMISADKKKKKNLLTLNEQARAKALQRLALLKRLYGGV